MSPSSTSSPSTRVFRVLVTLSLALIVPASPALAQQGSDTVLATGTGSITSYSLAFEAATAAVITLIVGGCMIALAPQGTRSLTDQALEMPGLAFVTALLGTIVTFVVAFVLALTGIGLAFAIPLLLIYAVFAFVGGELGLLTVGRLVADDWGPVLAVAVVASALIAGIPYLGGLIGVVVVGIGLGVLFMRLLEEERGDQLEGRDNDR